ncbi:hypothetical protein T4B_2986 [Trichinella pseudospiralis]|uniref:Uncharacterized protein n=1 Tax=Trichinella pseudospiralis TaxID=6337 RepID=A0A0V1HHJ2_TRIPS|nr:hypothetical protein T4E_10466 [Trichinella pseudospiralis]KRY70564.1 hypothetical protein T4A_5915 [Trichinella pseudospiralis]KRZ09884.1 hypothetical protein T4B_2986 [Trichinella pseudospiralis]
MTCQVLLLAELLYFLPAVLVAWSLLGQIFTVFYVTTIEVRRPSPVSIGIERVLGIARPMHDETQVLNICSGLKMAVERWTWPRDGIDQVLDVACQGAPIVASRLSS